MGLEIRNINIKDIRTGSKTEVIDHVLYVSPEDVLKLLCEDPRVSSVEMDYARPGESVRIIPVKDVIEPRAKLAAGPTGDAFPGVAGAIGEIGSGITYVLKGCAVVTVGPIVGFQEGIIDMSGPLTQYTPFAHLNNIVLKINVINGLDPHEHEEAVRLAGVKAAHFLARQAMQCPYDESEYYEFEFVGKKHDKAANLPRVAYVYLCMAQGLLHDTYLYGKDLKKMSPLQLFPLDVFDGALVSGNCVSPGSKTTTFHHLNNAVLKECFKRDGKEIEFAGVVINPLMVTLEDKVRNSMITAKLVEMLGAEGVVISQEGFGNPTTDLMMVCRGIEEKGIKTVLISNEDAGTDGMSEPLPDGTILADAIVSTGNSNARIVLPPMDRLIGDLKTLERVTGGFPGCISEDGSITIEIHGIMGSHNLQGYSRLSAVTI